MSEPGRLLDLPDEPKRRVRGVVTAIIASALVLAGGVIVARTFALGGGTRPWLTVQAVLALPVIVVAWFAAGSHRWRTAITVGAMVVGLGLQPVATAGITPSTRKLASIVDGLSLPGKTVRNVTVGNSRCRPACSELRRITIAKGLSYASARAEVEGNLRARGFTVRMYPHRAGEPERIDAENRVLQAQFELRYLAPAETRIASVWLVKGPTPDTSVG